MTKGFLETNGLRKQHAFIELPKGLLQGTF